MLNILKMLNNDKRLIDNEQTPLTHTEREYGAFRVLDANKVIFEEFGLNEAQATDLAIWLKGSIEHYSPDLNRWFLW